MVRWWAVALVSLALARPVRGDEMRIAVMEFTNNSTGDARADLDSLGKGLQSMLTTDLAQVAAFKLVERQRLQDIQAELKLSRTKEIDKSTAVKIGKLAGATHLCSGSFTVVGEQMRLDGRVVSVQTGEVLLAEQILGEKALFFELEKSLVQKIATAAGIKLAPKEKAQIGKVHTADFDAFKKFSQGVAAFDDKRYDDAIKALNEASQLDKDFKLASITLEEYTRIAAKVRAQADVAETATDASQRMEKQKALQGKQALASRLWAAIDKKGGGRVQAERLTATCLLAFLHWGNFYVSAPGLDTFALDRAGDALARRFFAEAVEAFPLVPPLCSRRYDGGSFQDLSAERFDDQFKFHTDAFTGFVTGTGMTRIQFLKEMREEGLWWGGHLQVDGMQLMRLYEQLYKLASKQNLTGPERDMFEEPLAKEARKMLLLDRSTALYVSLSSRSKDASKLRDYAEEIDMNKRITEVVLGKSTSPLAREHWLLDPFVRVDTIKNLYGSGKPTPNALEELHNLRDVTSKSYRGDYFLLKDIPFWVVVKEKKVLWSGPRTDPLRVEDLRYFSREEKDRDKVVGAVLVLDGSRRRAFTVRANIDPRVPDDFYMPRKDPAGPGRAQVGVAFGLNDIKVTEPDDRASKPLNGMAVLLGANAIQLVDIVSDRSRERFDVTVKEEQKLDLPAGKKVELSVQVDKGSVQVVADGKRVTFRVPNDLDGAYGLVLRGKGYIGVDGVQVKR